MAFGQGLQGRVQGFLVQVAEPFVEEQRIDPDIVAGQGQADEKALAAGKMLAERISPA